MDFGVSFPQTQIGNDPAIMRNFVTTAEDLGFERLTLVDHILGAKDAKDAPWAVHYTIEYGFHEPMTLFAWLAAFTSWSPPTWCCRNGRPNWWPSKRRRSIS